MTGFTLLTGTLVGSCRKDNTQGIEQVNPIIVLKNDGLFGFSSSSKYILHCYLALSHPFPPESIFRRISMSSPGPPWDILSPLLSRYDVNDWLRKCGLFFDWSLKSWNWSSFSVAINQFLNEHERRKTLFGTWIVTTDLPTYLVWQWVSAILRAFSSIWRNHLVWGKLPNCSGLWQPARVFPKIPD